MIYKSYDCNTFNIHTIKTDKFRTCHIEIIFSKNIIKDKLSETTMLCDFLGEVSKKYPTRRDVMIRLEELYKTSFYSLCSKVGKVINSTFVLDFVDPRFIKDKNYLENVIKFPFEMIENPLVKNNEFSIEYFHILQDRLIRDLNSLEEDSVKMVCRKSLEAMDKNSYSALFSTGTIEEIKKITPSSLYKAYQDFFKDNVCNIFVIGSLDMDKVVNLIKKYYHNRIICDTKLDFYVHNKLPLKEKLFSVKGNFIQANISMIFGFTSISKREKDIIIHVLNYILGNGGLTSKLYKKVREENSLCYAINSMFLKYDNLLMVQSSLENKDIKKACNLIKKCIKDIAKGNFTKEDLENAKNNLIISLKMCGDNNVALINNYVFNILDDFPRIDDRVKMYESVTKEEIVKLAKKIKINTTFILKGVN